MLIQRAITGVVFGAAVIIAVLMLPTWGMAAFFALLFAMGAWEWAGLARLGGAERIAYVAVLLLAFVTAPWWLSSAWAVPALLAIAALGWIGAFVEVLRYPRPRPLPGVAAAGFVVLLPSWAALVHLHAEPAIGATLTMTVIAIVWAADTGAYFAGRAFGRHKLAPSVSPGKTWEGVFGGLVAAAAVGAVAGFLTGMPPGVLPAIAAVTGIFSVLGDLAVSLAKRNVGVKDTGRLLPGHGGLLDRVDSLTAAAPVFVLGLAVLGVLSR